jgi:hypothetical protein
MHSVLPIVLAAIALLTPALVTAQAQVALPAALPLSELPLKGLSVADGQAPRIEAGADGFVISNPGAIQAEVPAPADAFLCRLGPAQNPDVVQLSIGSVNSLRCNALFSPQQDLALAFEGAGVVLARADERWTVKGEGPLTVRVSKDFMKTKGGVKWFRPLDKTVFKRAPAGWCTWYIYWQSITEDETIKNADWLAKNLRPFGCEYIQIDDGWQGVGHGSGENRDWYVTEPKKFPHGMKWLASEIRARGFKPGIWLIPFATSDEKTFQEHPELFIRRADGTTIGETKDAATGKVTTDWTGRYIVDPTGPAGRKWFHDLFTMLCPDWGYDYVKIDGQGGSRGAQGTYHDRLTDQKLGPDEAYREGLRAIKDVMGPERFLLNCGGQWDSCGYCEGIRTGGDVGPSWSGMQPAIRATMEHLYKNNICFYTDPDVLCVRPRGNNGSSLSFDQSTMWTTLMGITGQLLMASDKMYDLPAQYVDMVKRVFPVADIRPMDLYPLRSKPRVFDLRISKPEVGDWDVVALFNWSESATAQVEVGPVDLGLPEGRYVVYDVWHKRLVGIMDKPLTVALAPTSCRLLTLRALADHPQLLGTSRHLTQGADDLLAASWDDAARTWSGRSEVVGGDPYELRFSLPPGWAAAGEDVTDDGAMATLTITRDANETVPWSITFRQVATATQQPVVKEAHVTGVARDVTVTWSGEGALSYTVYRDGALLGQVAGTSFRDRVPRKGVTYRYEVSATGWNQTSPRVMAGEYTSAATPRGTAKDAWLQDLAPTSATQDWGTLKKGSSVEGNPILIARKTFEHGLGTHANSEINFAISNRYQRFEAQVGVDDEKGGMGSVVFQVFADGTKVFDSGVMRGLQAAKAVSVPLDGVDELTLVVTDAGDGINCDHADWGDARLVGNQ